MGSQFAKVDLEPARRSMSNFNSKILFTQIGTLVSGTNYNYGNMYYWYYVSDLKKSHNYRTRIVIDAGFNERTCTPSGSATTKFDLTYASDSDGDLLSMRRREFIGNADLVTALNDIHNAYLIINDPSETGRKQLNACGKIERLRGGLSKATDILAKDFNGQNVNNKNLGTLAAPTPRHCDCEYMQWTVPTSPAAPLTNIART